MGASLELKRSSAPNEAENLPAAHAEQLDLPPAEHFPAVQVQAPAAAAVYLPATQDVQTSSPKAAAVPAKHTAHAVAPAEE